jgi:hypothetical protein
VSGAGFINKRELGDAVRITPAKRQVSYPEYCFRNNASLTRSFWGGSSSLRLLATSRYVREIEGRGELRALLLTTVYRLLTTRGLCLSFGLCHFGVS